MGQATVNLNLSKSAYIRYDNPGTHYGTAAGVSYGLSGYKYLLFGFPGLASSIKRKRLLGFKLTTRLRFGQMPFSYYPLESDFNAQTVTYNSRPTFGSRYDFATSSLEQKGNWYDFTYPNTFPENKGQATQNAIRHGLAIASEYGPYSDDIDNWYGQITLSNSSPAYLTVAYDPDVTVTSKVQATTGPSGTTVSSLSAQLFSWQYVKNSSYYCYDETWTQASAKIFWKTAEESSYHQISISGSSLSYTMPSETFPAGKTINWYIQGTDTDGTTTSTDVFSFNTYAANLVLNNYPSGSNIYTGQALSFTWDVTESAGSHTQVSAVFYWKKQTASSWTQVSISGNTKRYTAPANTFPTGSTVQWYVTVTDKDGTTRTSSVMSFSTGSAAIKMITYPSGNSVNYGGALSFTWDFTSASGTYGQQSATLYWRASTSDPWSSIAASGSTKSLSVPAYTFPANSTITWYMSGTDSGGTTSQTNQMSFKTAAPVITPQDSPTSGYADPRQAITFRWYFTDGSNSYTQSSAALKWRVAGAEAWNTVSASGTTTNITIAANTFPTLSNIEWQLSGTVRGGYSSETSVFTFSTTAETAYAICLSPVGRAEDGSKDITFVWTVRNADGSLPSRQIVKWKQSTASAWTTILDTTSTDMFLSVEAGTFPAGGIDWQVIAYNRDSAAGPASTASFVCIVAPDAPQGLTATAVPRTLISWQSSGQEAYEIEIDGEKAHAAYGPSVTSWHRTEPLEDGVHSIRVRIQGAYGLWSDWASTSISVANVPDGSITPAGRFRTDAELRWVYDGSADPEVTAIYRDGIWIGTATGKTAFTDRYVLGEHVWRIEYWYADGNYTRSEDLTGSPQVSTLMIAALDGGEWMPLRYSEKSDRNIGFSWGVQNAQFHVTGSKWPVLETSPYETVIADYSCAFKEQACVRKFEQLRGRTVILKSSDGSVVIGGLVKISKTVTAFYTVISFSVQMNDWEDFVNDDQND